MMTSISKLPYHLKENIFSWIRIRDLYEVSVVSEEWWFLTVKIYKGILSEDDQLIKSLLDFYNREKQLLNPLMWYELVKYGNFVDVQLNSNPGPTVLSNFLESRVQIRSLCLRTKSWWFKYTFPSITQLETNFEDILNYFPHLEKLKLHHFDVVTSGLKIPKGIKEVHLSGIELNSIACSTLFEDSESIRSLKLDVEGLIFDTCVFNNLKSLSLHLNTALNVTDMKSILDWIRGHKYLTSVKLVGVKVTKEWFNLFSKTIANIRLENIHITKHLLTEFGTDGCYERRVMSFVCSDLRTVKRFTLINMWADVDEGLAEDEESTKMDYLGTYSCRPQQMEEKLSLVVDSRLTRLVQTITITDVSLALRHLAIECTDVDFELLRHCVPANVKNVALSLKGEFKEFAIDELFEQPQNLEELEMDTPTKISILPTFTGFTNLKILYLADVNREGIQNLLQECVSLVKLNLERPEKGCFTDLSPSCVSKTLREVNLSESDACIENVLFLFPNLEVLDLTSHLIRPLSMPTAIAKLNNFWANFDGFSDIGDNLASLALVMDTVNFPCKMFYLDLCRSSFTFILARNDSLMADFVEANYIGFGSAYCYGIPIRFLETRGIKILDDVKQFNEI